MNGVICCGKMTMSRTGIIGTRFISCFSRLNIRAPEFTPRARANSDSGNADARSGLSGLFEQTPVDLAGPNHVFGYHEIANLPLHREVVHHFQHEVFEDHAQAPSADVALESQLGDGVKGIVGKAEAD